MLNEVLRRQLEEDLEKIKSEEIDIDSQINEYLSSLSGTSFQKKAQISQVQSFIKKLQDFSPCFEAVSIDTSKLVTQISDCRLLSEKMSGIVRRLDVLQIRAQQALACTEDIINLKDCKVKLQAAIAEKKLPLAVSYIKQVHDIDAEAIKASDDIGSLQQAEREVKILVKEEFDRAVQESDINAVMSLCPLLQVLGLETEARDTFLVFMENNIFIAVSADIVEADNQTGNKSNIYTQTLSNIFNSTYLIFQQYLPIVIQGMENSYGDIHFIRRLHTKCEKQTGIVLKRYVKFRNLKNIIQVIGELSTSKKQSSTQIITLPSNAEMHVILDELALMIQYCCTYLKYLHQLRDGAEKRSRQISSSSLSRLNQLSQVSSDNIVFKDPIEFTQIVDELMNRYYMEGEIYLMRQSVKSALSRLNDLKDVSIAATFKPSDCIELDECFFCFTSMWSKVVDNQ